jgi:hypothetical protein
VAGAGSGLIDVNDELITVLAAQHLIGGLTMASASLASSRPVSLWVSAADRLIRLRIDKGRKRSESGDGEVLSRAKSLNP